MKSNIAKNLLLKNILLLSVLSSIDVVSENFSFFSANALILKTKANAEKTAAVEAEKKTWQAKVSENQDKIKTLQDDLNKAITESEKLSTEKTASEQEAKANFDKVTKEKEEAIKNLNDSKSKFEETSESLNNSINDLNNELTKVKSEKSELSQKITAAEKSRQDYESQVEKDQKTTKQTFDAQIKKLNSQISKKTTQLKKKTADLKKLAAEYTSQKTNASISEAKFLVDIEILKGEVIKLKTDLKSIVSKAKEIENKNFTYINSLKRKTNIEKKYFLNIITTNQNLELQKLSKIERLNTLLTNLTQKNLNLSKAGKILESKLMKKIATLTKKQAVAQKKYALIIKAYREAELKNFYEIDSLKTELNNAITINKSLLKITEKMHQAKIAEDIADSKLEAKHLLRIDNLKNDLHTAVTKNEILLKNAQKIKNQAENFRKIGNESKQKYQEKIKSLINDLNKSTNELSQLTDKYNNRGVWLKESKYFSQKDFHKIFKNINPKNNNKFLKKNNDLSLNNITKANKANFEKQAVNNAIPQQNPSYPVNYSMGQTQGLHAIPATNQLTNQEPVITEVPVEKQAVNTAISQQNPSYSVNYSMGQTQGLQAIPATNQLTNQGPVINEAKLEKQPVQNKFKKFNLKNLKTKMSGVINNLKKLQMPKTKDDQLVDFAVDSILKAVQKMTNNDTEKTNASMNLIGSGHELPQKLDAIIEVIKDQFNADVLEKALTEISNRYTQRLNFVNESLKHMYGTDGNKLTYWNSES